MDFWSTVAGHRLAEVLSHDLPDIAENIHELTKEVHALREENKQLSEKLERLLDDRAPSEQQLDDFELDK